MCYNVLKEQFTLKEEILAGRKFVCIGGMLENLEFSGCKSAKNSSSKVHITLKNPHSILNLLLL